MKIILSLKYQNNTSKNVDTGVNFLFTFNVVRTIKTSVDVDVDVLHPKTPLYTQASDVNVNIEIPKFEFRIIFGSLASFAKIRSDAWNCYDILSHFLKGIAIPPNIML